MATEFDGLINEAVKYATAKTEPLQEEINMLLSSISEAQNNNADLVARVEELLARIAELEEDQAG